MEYYDNPKTPEEKTMALLSGYNGFILSDQVKTQKTVAQINMALQTIQDDPYYPIIPLKFFEGMSMESIAEHMGIHLRTAIRKRKRLIRQLAKILCSDEVIDIIYEK